MMSLEKPPVPALRLYLRIHMVLTLLFGAVGVSWAVFTVPLYGGIPCVAYCLLKKKEYAALIHPAAVLCGAHSLGLLFAVANMFDWYLPGLEGTIFRNPECSFLIYGLWANAAYACAFLALLAWRRSAAR